MKNIKKMAALLLCGALSISAIFPAAAGEQTAGNTAEEADIEELLENMTLKDKVAQMMIVSFRTWKEVPETEGINKTVENADEIPAVSITEVTDEVRECLGSYHFGGSILYAENCKDAEQTLRLVAEEQAANQAGGGIPMLFSIDQEGTIVARLSYGTTGPGNMAIAATGDLESAKTMGRIYGEELGLLGIRQNYAPVVDVNNNPANPVIGVRSFGDDPEKVASYSLPFIEGLEEAGCIATLKHFPGHGNAGTDSHIGLPLIESTYEELKEFELIPFQAAIDEGVDMIMTAHIQYPQIEEETYISTSTGEEIFLPATMSHRILTDILRGDMGFEGVVVSDSLSMGAISDHFSVEDTLRLTINAGVDMLMPPQIVDNITFRQTMDMVDMVVGMVEKGEISEERIDEAVTRILTVKKKYGILDQTDFTVTEEDVKAAVEGVGSAANREAAWDIAENGLTLLKNEGDAFPVKLEAGQKALILFGDCCASRVATGELAEKLLREQEAIPEDAGIEVLVNTKENEEECLEAAAAADHVILVYQTYGEAYLDPSTDNGMSSAVFDKIIEARHAEGKQVVFVSCMLPYDAARFKDADAILLTYGSTAMRELLPEAGEGSAYAPNLPAGLCACFGLGETKGELPVMIPALDENYKMTEEAAF